MNYHRTIARSAVGAICIAVAISYLLLVVPEMALAQPTPFDGLAMAASITDGRLRVQMPVPEGGPALNLVIDSGGGSSLLSKQAAVSLKMRLKADTDQEAIAELGPNVQTGKPTAFMIRHWPGVSLRSEFTVVPEIFLMKGWPAVPDGILGQQWLAGHIWTWDYPHQCLTLRPPHWQPASGAHPLDVSFKTDARGQRQTDFPRITVRVANEELPMLFDTGATTVLTESAVKAIADAGAALRATSMISHSVFERWHKEFPAWRVLDDAQLGTLSRMILVPEIELGGYRSGAVWFTERPDNAYHEFMTSMMSGLVEGSIGGNALKEFVVSIDYPNSKAWVQIQ